MTIIRNGFRCGEMRVPVSKSHAHRVLIAEFLAGCNDMLRESSEDCDDVRATKRCLMALSEGCDELDVGESGTTRRLLGPVAAALGRDVTWVMKGRLAARPQINYRNMRPGIFSLPGDVSSQFVSGLLFALPILPGDSEIRLMTPLASRGYVDMTLMALQQYGIVIEEKDNVFFVKGRQFYREQLDGAKIETDWSGAAFIFAMNHLGNKVKMSQTSKNALVENSLQPDRKIVSMLESLRASGKVELDVDECPDIFPILSVVAAARDGITVFSGTRRLKLKESDRTAAMNDVLAGFGVNSESDENTFTVFGSPKPFKGGNFTSCADHRIAMSVAVGATYANAKTGIDDISCAAKSFPTFFTDFSNLEIKG